MTKIKICGIKTAEDALEIAKAGADAIGIVFVPSANRCISLEHADAILNEFRKAWGERAAPSIVGMFGDQPISQVNDYVTQLNLDAVQLCGQEGMSYCSQIVAPIYKVIPINMKAPWAVAIPKMMIMLQRHTMAGHHPVLDAQLPGQYGGTGQAFEWSNIKDLSLSFSFNLAGGLNALNVADAISLIRPSGVDSSSGTETDGHKDPEKIRAFVTAVRDVDARLAPKGIRKLFSKVRQ